MWEVNLNNRSKIAKNVAILGFIIFVIGLIIYLLFSYTGNDKLLLWALLLESFGFAFMIGGGIKYWAHGKNLRL